MKKILLYSLAAISLSFLSGCEKYLETVSPSSDSVDATFASVTDANNALMGAYALMGEDAMYSSRMSLFWQTNTDIEITSLGSNDYKNTDRRGLSSYGSRPSIDIADITNPWDNLYKAIERLNLCIVNIPVSPANSGTTAKQMMTYYGEALTLRALFYMELCRQFGDVPFRTEPANPTTFYIPRTDRDVIYERLLVDLDEAIGVLPWANEAGATLERVTKGFALGLQARIAMYRAGYSIRQDGITRQGSNPEIYYQIAKDACERLIEEGPHHLTPKFKDYFVTQCENKVDNINRESLFEVGFGIDKTGEIGYSNGTRFSVATKYSGISTQGYVNTTPIFLYSYDPEDSRRDVTVNIYTYENAPVTEAAQGPAGIRQKIATTPQNFRVGKWSVEYLTGSALTKSAAATAKFMNGINWPIMRMADVYLLLAEAEYRLNGVTATAQDALKTVRRRAFPTSSWDEKVEKYVGSLAGEAFFDAIVNERAWELAGEGVRKYDLVRWNLLSTKLQDMVTENLAFLSTGNLPAKYPNSKYNPIPSTLYYDFDTAGDYPKINMATANLYANTPKPAGYYEYTNWMTLKASTLTDYTTWIQTYVNYGYDFTMNNHLFAFPSTAVSTSGGLWGNDPYWAQVKQIQ